MYLSSPILDPDACMYDARMHDAHKLRKMHVSMTHVKNGDTNGELNSAPAAAPIESMIKLYYIVQWEQQQESCSRLF